MKTEDMDLGRETEFQMDLLRRLGDENCSGLGVADVPEYANLHAIFLKITLRKTTLVPHPVQQAHRVQHVQPQL